MEGGTTSFTSPVLLITGAIRRAFLLPINFAERRMLNARCSFCV
jgi:hypothetical protein